MLIGRIQGCTRVLGKPAGWDESNPDTPCQWLPVIDLQAEHGGPAMVSAWWTRPSATAKITGPARERSLNQVPLAYSALL